MQWEKLGKTIASSDNEKDPILQTPKTLKMTYKLDSNKKGKKKCK